MTIASYFIKELQISEFRFQISDFRIVCSAGLQACGWGELQSAAARGVAENPRAVTKKDEGAHGQCAQSTDAERRLQTAEPPPARDRRRGAAARRSAPAPPNRASTRR